MICLTYSWIDMEFYRTFLNQQDSDLYRRIFNRLWERAESISIPSTPSAQVNRILHAVLADHPELAWATGKWKGKPDNTDVICPFYGLTEDERILFLDRLPRIRETGEGMLALPPLKRVRIVFDTLLEMCVYDPSAPHSQTAFGSLIDRRAVCRGIAKGFQLMMDAASVPAICAEGTLDGKALHVWNIVRIDGSNYHVDVTMGYPQFEYLYKEKGLRYNGKYSAFCVSDKTLKKTHRWDPAAIPLRCDKDLSNLIKR